ncbi:DUF389 domain-containing protein [Rhabdothermincola salaria]|uniref:DUF389 domain-containing protein n=1 Tax=Rhabdothermincola salaria TaxID=2903142 RepID=UPI001E412901|nr:DUF389 domain-containing protein [Rhabdothermincola salaria]MCD9623231.1 DUF389 domain-containing protein [Rhabdothermincola salaria]
MPLLRITCPTGHTDAIVAVLSADAAASEIAVIPRASRMTDGDVVLAEVPRSSVDRILALLPHRGPIDGLHVAVEGSEVLYPRGAEDDPDDDAVVWAAVTQEVHDAGRLSWINVALMVIAAAIAAVGIIEDQLLLIVGAMALSPDYFPVADTCLSVVHRNWDRVRRGLIALVVSFTAAAAGAWALTEILRLTGVARADAVPSQQLTLFISEPDTLSVVVAVLAGIAGALAITLPDARGLVGVFVSITTIPAAANIGVALAGRDHSELFGASVQLGVNVASLLVAGVVTLELRRRLA